jgi:hypothetical protein
MKDLNDVLRNGGPDAVRAATDAAVEYGPHAADDKAKPKPPRIKLMPFESLKPTSRPESLIEGLIPRGGLVVVWGPPKCGKSFWTMDAALHIALGREYRGRRVRGGAVVYCAFEGAAGYGKRAEAFRIRKLSGHADPVRFYLVAEPMNFVAKHRELIAAIRATLGEAKPAAAVLDTLNRSLAGSESDDKDMAAYVKAADAVRAAFDCAVIIVHHCGVDGSRPRGHTSLTGAVDAQLAVKRDNAGNVIVEVEWMKDGEDGGKIASRLEVVEVGADSNETPITSCVVVPADEEVPAAASAKPARMPKTARTALKALREAIDECGLAAPASNHVPAGVKVTTIEQWRQYAYKCGISAGEDRAKQKAFKSAFDFLNGSGEVAVWDDHVWLAR